MVESAVSDVVCPAVTTEDPLAACRDECLVFHKLLASVASACLAHRDEGVCNLACDLGVVAVLKPFGEEVLHLACAARACKTLLHKACYGSACPV